MDDRAYTGAGNCTLRTVQLKDTYYSGSPKAKTDRAPVVSPEPFNKLSPAEVERLACLLEEAGEVQQAIGKILRHGYGRKNYDALRARTNREALNDALTDLMRAILRMQKAADISPAITENHWERHLGNGWMHHQD